MAVRCTQSNDGTVSGTEIIVPGRSGMTDQQMLDWKVQKHQADGWSTRKQGQRWEATKTYTAAERALDPGVPATCVRSFRVA